MRVAVVGGSGTAGRPTVEALQRAGHQPVVIARSQGIDVTTGEGLDRALEGTEVVIDVTSFQGPDPEATRKLFEASTKNLLAAETRAGVKRHVLLSILGLDRIEGNAHYAGKRVQEKLVVEGPIPYTLQRVTQFHDFPATVVGWLRSGDSATIPPLLMQPIAPADVGAVLAELAGQPARGRVTDVAGPQPEDFIDMARRTLAARGESLRLIPSWRSGLFGVEAAGEALLPGPEVRLMSTSFDAWLKEQGRASRSPGTRAG